MDKDYSKISTSYEDCMPQELKTFFEELQGKDDYFKEVLQEMRNSPCAYAKPGSTFYLIDSANDDLYEHGVSKDVITFTGRDKVLFAYARTNNPAFVISGNNIDGYYVFHLDE